MTPANQARDAIMQSIRAYLDESPAGGAHLAQPATIPAKSSIPADNGTLSLVKVFCEQLESVGGHCVSVQDEDDAGRVLSEIVTNLRRDKSAQRIALSDSPIVRALAPNIAAGDVTVCPAASELFAYDVGITSAQAAIAETGTLVLESEREHNRLVSLLPPVHIAVVEAASICRTLGDALRKVHTGDSKNMSRAITFITGPSRTADIELTLTIGVHGPKEVYVIIIDATGQ